MVIGVTVGIGTVDLNCLIVSSSRSTSSGQSWSVVVFSAVATARNSIRKTWAKRRGGVEGEGVKKEREKRAEGREKGKDERKKSRVRGERNAREAYDLEKRRREVKRRGTSGEIKIESESFSCCSPRRHPRPPDWFTITIHRIYKTREFYKITQPPQK